MLTSMTINQLFPFLSLLENWHLVFSPDHPFEMLAKATYLVGIYCILIQRCPVTGVSAFKNVCSSSLDISGL